MPLATLAALQWYGPCCASVTMEGSGDLTGTMKSDARMGVTMSGSGEMALEGTVGVDGSVTMAGAGDLTGTMKSDARMGVKMNLGDFPSAFEVAQETWALNTSAFSGQSAGAKLNAAGSAGDPWASLISGMTAGDMLALMHTLTTELHRINGLDPAAPLVDTPDSITAGDIELEQTGDGIVSRTTTRKP